MAVLAAACFAAWPAAVLAAPPPTLDGVGFTAEEGFPFGGNFEHTCGDPGPDGVARGEFGAYDTIAGAYPGHIIDAGTFDIGPSSGGFADTLRAAFAEFTIDSKVGYVSGVEWPARIPQDVFCGASEFAMNYRAIIETPEGGVFTDAGSSPFSIFQTRLNPPAYDFSQSFDSSQSSVERVLFGNHVVPRSLTPVPADTKSVSPFTLYMPATVRKVVAWVDGKGATSGSQVLRAVLYRNGTAGGPGAYVTRSFEFTVPAGMSGRYIPFWLAPIPHLDPGVYWIGIQSGGVGQVARFGWRPRAGARRFNGDAFADGASDPFGAGTGVDDKQLAAFAAGSYP